MYPVQASAMFLNEPFLSLSPMESLCFLTCIRISDREERQSWALQTFAYNFQLPKQNFILPESVKYVSHMGLRVTQN